MQPRTLDYLAQHCGGTLIQGPPDQLIYGVSTDSRKVQRGELFVALAGPNFDGHDYLGQAVQHEAGGLLVAQARLPQPLPPSPLIATDDTREALGRLAASYRNDFDLPLIAVGGSNGKTTTKNLLSAVLAQTFETLSSEASFNNEIGVPLTLLNLNSNHQAAVLEVGTNHPGELPRLLRMIRPQMSVLTSIGPEHLEFFQDIDGVVREEGWLGEALGEEGIFFLNGEGPWKDQLIARSVARAVTVGFGPHNDWQASEIQVHPGGTRFSVRAPNDYFSGCYQMRLLGKHQVTNALLALAVGAHLDMDRAELQRGLASCPPPKMRLQLREAGPWRILDDSYNANVDSMKAALATLHELPASGRRIAVLGEMAELGAASDQAHAEVGTAAGLAGVDALVLIGTRAQTTAAAARAVGLAEVMEFQTVEEAAQVLRVYLREGDLILIKASRAGRLDRLVDALRVPETVISGENTSLQPGGPCR